MTPVLLLLLLLMNILLFMAADLLKETKRLESKMFFIYCTQHTTSSVETCSTVSAICVTHTILVAKRTCSKKRAGVFMYGLRGFRLPPRSG
jgi:hypothetical protein